jgi:spore maturation protein CgeB
LGGSERVPHVSQPQVYARGHLAINIAQGNDEEGLSHKPFQIAACGVPMLHNDVYGLSECFTPGEEAVVFDSPREARERVAELLADKSKSRRMADASRSRVCRAHTWRQRLPRMLELAGVELFQATKSSPTAQVAFRPRRPGRLVLHGRHEQTAGPAEDPPYV